MTNFSSSLTVSCYSGATKPRAIWLEPLGEDYWLFPEDEIEITAYGLQLPPSFQIVERDDRTIVYVADSEFRVDYEVKSNGQFVTCGFQRNELVGYVQHALSIMGRGIVLTCEKDRQTSLTNGADLRLIIPDYDSRLVPPGYKTLSAILLGMETLNVSDDVTLENRRGLLVEAPEIKSTQISVGTAIYLVY